jgi:hypothetical protein
MFLLAESYRSVGDLIDPLVLVLGFHHVVSKF